MWPKQSTFTGRSSFGLATRTSRVIGFVLALGTSVAQATEVQVRVVNVADASGSVRVEVCPESEWLNGCTFSAHVPARQGITVVTVPGVPPGHYGVIAHHDSNDDGDVNRNFIGLPTEGIGFSRDAAIRLGPPHFSDAVLDVAGASVSVDITLHFERPLH